MFLSDHSSQIISGFHTKSKSTRNCISHFNFIEIEITCLLLIQTYYLFILYINIHLITILIKHIFLNLYNANTSQLNQPIIWCLLSTTCSSIKHGVDWGATRSSIMPDYFPKFLNPARWPVRVSGFDRVIGFWPGRPGQFLF